MGHIVPLLPSPVPLTRRQRSKQDTLGGRSFYMRITKPAKHSLRLGTAASMLSFAAGSEKSIILADKPREEQEVSPVWSLV